MADDSRYPYAILMRLWPFLPLFLFIAMFSLVGATYPTSDNKLDLSLSIGTVIKDCADCPPMVAIPSVGRISISSSFHPLYVSRHELTWNEYLKAVREGGCVPPSKDLGVYYNLTDPGIDDDHPVDGIGASDFHCYLSWINRKTGKNYRIPTPEEWEHAARAGTTTNYYWGDDLGYGHAIVDGHFDSAKARQRKRQNYGRDQRSGVRSGVIFPVETLSPNPWGLYDMVGNVREIVAKERDADRQCIHRLGLARCHLIETRGGDGFRSNATDYISKSQTKYYANPSANVGFRLIRN